MKKKKNYCRKIKKIKIINKIIELFLFFDKSYYKDEKINKYLYTNDL